MHQLDKVLNKPDHEISKVDGIKTAQDNQLSHKINICQFYLKKHPLNEKEPSIVNV